MPLTKDLIGAAVERYSREADRYEKLARVVGEACRTLLESNGIRGAVQFRAKAADRLREKLYKYLRSGEHAAEFVDLDSIFLVLKDLAGVRITTYVETDRARVIALIQQRFSGFAADATIAPDVKDQPFGFYRATHCLVRLRDEEIVGPYWNVRGLACEIQVCSQLAHVYHELEHDVRYKPLSGDLSKTENDLLNALARLMEVGDTIINQTLDAAKARLTIAAGKHATERTSAIHDKRSLDLLNHSPMLIDLAGMVRANRPTHDLPRTPAAFYREVMNLLAAGAQRHDAPRAGRRLHAEELLQVLTKIAWELFSPRNGASTLTQHAVLTAIKHTSATSDTAASQLLDEFVDLGFLKKQSDPTEIAFCDPTFHEFLAASYLASRINADGWHARVEVYWDDARSAAASELLAKQAFEPAWGILISFVAGLLLDIAPLFALLADRTKDDLYRHRLGLLCQCYRGLDPERQLDIAEQMHPVFADVLRIARRCEHDDTGHKKPWIEWVELLLSSPDAAEQLVGGLLTLRGRYRGWAVSAKVLELLDRVLTKENISPTVVETIARLSESDEDHWRVNTARLALRLADDGHKRVLVARFLNLLVRPETAIQTKIRLAEAVATSGDASESKYATDVLLAYSQDTAVEFKDSADAVHALVSVLETDLAPKVAPLLINHLLNPSSQHHFWLGWRIIGKAEAMPTNAWSAAFLSLILFADRENDQRLKLWSAQALSQHPDTHARELGVAVLWNLVQLKESHSWTHAARWLVEHGPAQAAEKAREALISEAGTLDSDRRMEAMAELLEMRAVDPLGGPIRDIVHQAVARELEEYPRKYGPRLHVFGPDGPKGNVDMELLADNPAAVIKALHTFGGPSFYVRDWNDPNDEEKKMRHWNAQLLCGTRYWPDVLRRSWQAVRETFGDGATPDRDGALGVVLFAGSGSDLLELLRQTFHGKESSSKRMRHALLEELDERGWRLRFRGRNVEILRCGNEDGRGSSADQPFRAVSTAKQLNHQASV
ncbi:MAG TPA: RelA/SpoT domain-containing protein [Thermoanaerobaculia bacterium]|nr:RelA/SpoT domain-containing protein [Thermoanaerobaculia bacterium]